MPQQSIAVPGSQVQFQEVMFGSSQLPKSQVHERLMHFSDICDTCMDMAYTQIHTETLTDTNENSKKIKTCLFTTKIKVTMEIEFFPNLQLLNSILVY